MTSAVRNPRPRPLRRLLDHLRDLAVAHAPERLADALHPEPLVLAADLHDEIDALIESVERPEGGSDGALERWFEETPEAPRIVALIDRAHRAEMRALTRGRD